VNSVRSCYLWIQMKTGTRTIIVNLVIWYLSATPRYPQKPPCPGSLEALMCHRGPFLGTQQLRRTYVYRVCRAPESCLVGRYTPRLLKRRVRPAMARDPGKVGIRGKKGASRIQTRVSSRFTTSRSLSQSSILPSAVSHDDVIRVMLPPPGLPTCAQLSLPLSFFPRWPIPTHAK
jgi:hypothetical protein